MDFVGICRTWVLEHLRSRWIVVALILVASNAFAQSPAYTHYFLDNGLSSSTVYGMIQDRQGYMWFATESGASRFDGTTFQNFTVSDGLSGNDVLRIFQDRQGRIWFMPFNEGVSYYLDGKVHNSTTDPWLKGIKGRNFLLACIDDNRGNVWFGDDAGAVIKLSQDSTVTVDNSMFDVVGNNFRTFWIDEQQDVLAISGRSIYNLSEGCKVGDIRFGLDRYLAPRIADLGHDSLLFAIGRQFVLKDGEQTQFLHLDPEVAFGEVLYLKASREHGLWVGTRSGAAHVSQYAIRDSTLEVMRYETFLPDKSVSSIFEDSEGNCWMSTIGNGVYFFSSLNAKSYSGAPLAPSNFVNKVLVDRQKRVWVGFDRAIVGQFQDGKLDLMQLPDTSHGRGRTTDIFEDRDGNVFVMSDQAYCIIEPNGRRWPMRGGCKAMAQLPDGRYFASHSWEVDTIGRASVAQFDSAYIATRKNTDVLLKKRTQALLGTHDGRLLIGTLEGLIECSCTDQQWKKVDFVPSFSISEILETPDGVVWLSTPSKGVGYIYEGRFFAVTAAYGLASDICHGLAQDEGGAIYVATNRGISRIQVEDYASKRLKIRSFGKNFGLASDEVRSVAVGGGKIYAATAQGLTVLDAGFLMASPPAVPVHITEFSALGQSMPWQSGNLVLEPRQNRVSVKFTAVSFRNADKLQFRYQLGKEGGESSWIPTSSRQLEFPSLPPGAYHLRIQAGIDGIPETMGETYIDFEVQPAFYQTTWFLVLMLLLTAAAVAGIFYFAWKRVLSQERKRNEIQRRIAESEQKALRSQMNPHFIFNSLNSIEKFFITNRPQEANAFIADFSDLIRSILDLSGKTAISLREELRFVELFLTLECHRMDHRFTFSVEVDEELAVDMLMVPPIILQPFAENAVWHGISLLENQKGHIRLTVDGVENGLRIHVTDNGIGRARSEELKSKYRKKHKSSGIRITNERLELLNMDLKGPDKFSISIMDLQHADGTVAGTDIIVFVPLAFSNNAL